MEWCVRYHKTVIVLTLAAFVGALLLFRLVPQQFFPPSARLELLLDIKLAEGASLRSTGEEVQRLEKMLQGHDGIDNYVAYVGTGSPRFYLPLDQQLPAASFAQVVVLAKDLESREALRKWLIERMNEDFPHLRSHQSPGERAAGGLSGAVPGFRRGHPAGSRTGAQGRRQDAREPARGECAPGLEEPSRWCT